MEISERHAKLCTGLADRRRILILYALVRQPLNVSELAAMSGMSQPTVSRHLKILRDCGAVASERRGKAVYYLPSDMRIIEALDLMRAALTDQMILQGELARSASERPRL